jgi:hypothetical protein
MNLFHLQIARCVGGNVIFGGMRPGTGVADDSCSPGTE